MNSHRDRLKAIFAAWTVSTIGIGVLVALGTEAGTGFGALVAAEGLLTTALIDAVLVERRRRNPATPAISDDVKS